MATVGPANLKSTIAHHTTDPLRNFKFLVSITGKGNIGYGIDMGFMSVSGLSINTEIIPYREGGMNTTALPLDAPILTVDGFKPMGDIEVGDRVIDPRGDDSKVVGIYPAGTKDVYRVTLADGSTAVACYGHLWEFEVRNSSTRETLVASTLDMKDAAERDGYHVLLPKLVPSVDAELPDRSDSDRRVVSVEHVGQQEVQCIEVSADSHLYISHDYVPSHNTQKMPGQSDFSPLTLSKGVAIGAAGNANMKWMKELFAVMQGTGSRQWGAGDFRTTVYIKVLDHPVTKNPNPSHVTAGWVPVRALFTVYNAWPTTIAFSDFDAGANALMIQQMTLAHEGFDFVASDKYGAPGIMSVAGGRGRV